MKYCGGPSSYSSNSPECKNAIGVSAQKGWQNTGVNVIEGETVEITYTVGLWNGNIDDRHENDFHKPDGPKKRAAIRNAPDPCPGCIEDSLCARIGSEVFWVGTHVIHKSSQSGSLELTINDRGYHDNRGMVFVKIVKVQ